MTIQDYFVGKISMLHLPIADENLTAFLQSKGVGEPNQQVGDFRTMDILFLEIILLVLAMPNVSEGDMSISYDRNALMRFYRAECKRLGVDNNLDDANAPKVRDMSFLA